MTIIRAEIRKWRKHRGIVPEAHIDIIEGYVYSDKDAVYGDGEHITIIGWKDLREASTFFLLETFYGFIYKLEKDEQVK